MINCYLCAMTEVLESNRLVNKLVEPQRREYMFLIHTLPIPVNPPVMAATFPTNN